MASVTDTCERVNISGQKKIPITVYLHWVSFLIMQGHMPILSVEKALYFEHMRRVRTYPD